MTVRDFVRVLDSFLEDNPDAEVLFNEDNVVDIRMSEDLNYLSLKNV